MTININVLCIPINWFYSKSISYYSFCFLAVPRMLALPNKVHLEIGE